MVCYGSTTPDDFETTDAPAEFKPRKKKKSKKTAKKGTSKTRSRSRAKR